MEKIPTFQYHYFLDEAGDPSFYGKGKTIIIGQPGVSLCYILGMIKFNNDLDIIRSQVTQLQKEIETNPYFKNIGSIEKKKQKHGFYFHATDDMPDVRIKFFEFINVLDCSFEATVGAKIPSLYAKKHNANPNEFYADLLSHLLYDKLISENRIVLNIAERGASTRFENLKLGLQKAVDRFTKHNPEMIVNPDVQFNVQNQTSEPLLNIADYFCWSIQRVFEKGETRYYDYLNDKIKIVVDIYDEEAAKTGKNIYTTANPLTVENKKSLSSI